MNLINLQSFAEFIIEQNKINEGANFKSSAKKFKSGIKPSKAYENTFINESIDGNDQIFTLYGETKNKIDTFIKELSKYKSYFHSKDWKIVAKKLNDASSLFGDVIFLIPEKVDGLIYNPKDKKLEAD